MLQRKKALGLIWTDGRISARAEASCGKYINTTKKHGQVRDFTVTKLYDTERSISYTPTGGT